MADIELTNMEEKNSLISHNFNEIFTYSNSNIKIIKINDTTFHIICNIK